MKNLLHSLVVTAACLASLHGLAASPSALVNPGFEDVLGPDGGPYVPGSSYYGVVPGWRIYYPLVNGGFRYWDGEWSFLGTLAGRAEPLLIAADRPGWKPLEGQFSVAFQSYVSADAVSTDHGWEPYYVGRVGFAQTVQLPDEITELTCYYYDADRSTPSLTGGSLVLSFNNQMLGYTLEPTVGPNGPTTLLRADLTPVAGQYGELRIGIEGRGFFVVDNIVVIPEASTVAGGCVVALGMLMVVATQRQHSGDVSR